MYKEDIKKKIHELEQEMQNITIDDYHRREYKKLLQGKIDSYKRLYKVARHKKEANPLVLALGTNPKTRGDSRREKRGKYTTL